MNKNDGLTTGKKAVIISLLSVIAVLLLVVAIVLPTSSKRRVVNSRTIMIFMAGNNLETNNAIASSDLSKIIPESIDLDKTKVLLYTGGTKRWHNFVSSEEEAIYELTNNGFVKLQTFTKSNMGYDAALAQFLNYSYNYSKTDGYDLIFWDHGLGALGSISDENTNDFLDLSEIKTAFERSPFNENNKLETVVFRTCLNATLEVASTIYPYADYMVASEETTIGANGYGVLDFINNVTVDNDGLEYGKTFIASYQNQIEALKFYGETVSSYSVVDLSKIPELLNEVDDFFGTIDVNSNYNELARMRSSMYQYGESEPGVSDYDTVDLYELIDNLKKYNTKGAEKIQKTLKNDVVVFNWATTEHSNGLSIYYPFSGRTTAKALHFALYDKINVSNNYKKFITDFDNGQTSSSYTFSFDLSKNETSHKGDEFKLKLNKEQIENFGSASYIIFKKNDDGTFTNIYVGKDAKLDDDGYVTTNISNNLITIVDDNDKSKSYPIVWQAESASKDYREYIIPVTLNRTNDEGWPILENANIHLKVDKKNKAHISEVLLQEKGDDINKASGTHVDLKNYSSIDFYLFRYNILDSNGNYTSEWTSNNTLYMFEVNDNKYHFEVTSIDNKEDYYCVFVIKDVQNKGYYSNLISMK